MADDKKNIPEAAPPAEASAEGDHKGLQSGDGRSEKLHIASYSPGTKSRP